MIRAASALVLLLATTAGARAYDPDMVNIKSHSATRALQLCDQPSKINVCNALVVWASARYSSQISKDINTRNLCLPITNSDKDIFVRLANYLRLHPEKKDSPYIDVIGDSIADFPCPRPEPKEPPCINAFCEAKPILRR